MHFSARVRAGVELSLLQSGCLCQAAEGRAGLGGAVKRHGRGRADQSAPARSAPWSEAFSVYVSSFQE